MTKKWYKDKEKIYLLLVMLVYSILASIVVFTHEPYRDEAQAWLIARDTNIFEMFSLSKYEGSPMLWHCLVNILTTLGLPYISINIMHLVLNLITIYLFNKYAPFNKYIKIAITFSHMMLYQYLAFARSYILVPLILFLIAIIYEKRHEKTVLYCMLLLLLQNVCLYSIPIAIVLFITYIIEKAKLKKCNSKNIILFSLIALSMILSLILLINPVKEKALYEVNLPQNMTDFIDGGFKALESIGTIVLPIKEFENLKIIVGAIVLSLTTISLWKDKKIMIIFLVSTIVIGGIFAFVSVNIFHRHIYLYVVLYLFSCWISKELNIKHIKLVGVELIVVVFSMQTILLLADLSVDLSMPYSNSQKLQKMIIEYGYENYEIFATHSPYVSALLPYFSHERVCSLEDNQMHTYVIWNEKFNNFNRITELDINRAIYDAITKYNGQVLFIGDENDRWLMENKFDLIFPVSDDEKGAVEELLVYKLKNY